jgi:hypothetical protein
MQNLTKIVLVSLALLGVFALGYIVLSKNSTNTTSSTARPGMNGMMMGSSGLTMTPPIQMGIENFVNPAPADSVSVSSGMHGGMPTQAYGVDASESINLIEQPQGLQQTQASQMNELPSECYPKDVLSSADLLPRDANSLWAQVNPSGQGSLADQNFLTSGYSLGVNTVGQTLRNANRQLRSEPLNPQVKVSPWMQTTIEPDINRRPLEIQGDL